MQDAFRKFLRFGELCACFLGFHFLSLQAIEGRGVGFVWKTPVLCCFYACFCSTLSRDPLIFYVSLCTYKQRFGIAFLGERENKTVIKLFQF